MVFMFCGSALKHNFNLRPMIKIQSLHQYVSICLKLKATYNRYHWIYKAGPKDDFEQMAGWPWPELASQWNSLHSCLYRCWKCVAPWFLWHSEHLWQKRHVNQVPFLNINNSVTAYGKATLCSAPKEVWRRLLRRYLYLASFHMWWELQGKYL